MEDGNMLLQPCRPVDARLDKIQFPCIVQPKIDGVRACNFTGITTARSLKPFANEAFNSTFGRSEFLGLDGELCLWEDSYAGNPITREDLCRVTTSAVNSILGYNRFKWVLFDYVTEHSYLMPYRDRLNHLSDLIEMNSKFALREWNIGLEIIETRVVYNIENFKYLDDKFLEEGYEGTIIRSINAPHKNGAATLKGMEAWRYKQFVDEEAVVLEVIEGQENRNHAQTNELGLTFRSTHKENMVPNGKVGALLCRRIKTGKTIKVAAGKMTEEEKLFYFNNPHLIVGEIITYRSFPRGVKDQPRFATFQNIRAKVDYLPSEK